MSYDYSGFSDRAAVLIARYGSSGTLTRPGKTYNPETGNMSGSDDEYSIIALLQPIDTSRINDTVIKSGDSELVISPKTPAGTTAEEPLPGDLVTFEGKNLSVINVMMSKPTDTAIAYICHVRES